MMHVWFKKQRMENKLFGFYNELSKSPVSSNCKVCNLNKLFQEMPSKHSPSQVACSSEFGLNIWCTCNTAWSCLWITQELLRAPFQHCSPWKYMKWTDTFGCFLQGTSNLFVNQLPFKKSWIRGNSHFLDISPLRKPKSKLMIILKQ